MSVHFKYTFSNSIKSLNNEILKAYTDLAQQKEANILNQLTELISRGLIVIEQTQPVLTIAQELDEAKHTIKISQSVRLVPKDFEYIKKLEEENNQLKEQLKIIKNALNYEE